MKNVKPEEVNSSVQTPRSNDPVSGNRLRVCLQNFETLEKELRFTKVCEDASFSKRESLLECGTKPLQTWMMVLEIELQHAESIHTLEKSFELEDCMSTFSHNSPHVCCQVYKSQSATLSRKPQDSGPYQPVSTSTCRQSRAMSHVAQYRPSTCHPE